MPQPAEVQRLAERLVGIYRRANDEIAAELARIQSDPARFRRTARLREMEARVTQLMRHADDQARLWLERSYPRIYELGAGETARALGEGFAWTTPHLDAVSALAEDTFSDLLAATRHVSRTTKLLVRELAQGRVLAMATTGRSAAEGARDLRRILADRGIWAVTYKDGSRHGIGEYAQVVIRSKSAVAYNAGTLNHAVTHGTEWFEVFDGAGCGWLGHDDVDKANGTIRSAAECASVAISHPNCVRSYGPRPDVTSREQAGQRGPTTTAAQRADQEAFQRAREASIRRSANRRARQRRRRERLADREARRG